MRLLLWTVYWLFCAGCIAAAILIAVYPGFGFRLTDWLLG